MIMSAISVIIPVYNIEAEISRCIESVIHQSFSNLEIILVDDGSTDGSGRICDEYAKKDVRIKSIHKANGGLADARNAGMDAATGEYWAFVDGDDWVDCSMYEDMYNYAKETGADIVTCRYREINGNAEISFSREKRIFDTNEALIHYVTTPQPNLISTSVWTKLYKKEIIKNMRFPVGMYYEDMMFTPIALSRAEKIAIIDTPYYNYVRGRDGSIMTEAFTERYLTDEKKLLKEQIKFFKEYGNTFLVKTSRKIYCERLLFYAFHIHESRMKNGQSYLKEIRYDLREGLSESIEFTSHNQKRLMILCAYSTLMYYWILKIFFRGHEK